jgi:hypothetical protein
MTGGENILLIHYYYPPIQSAGVLRNYFFSVEFASKFRDVFLVTTSNRNVLPKEELPIPSNLSVIEAKTFDYRTLTAGRIHSSHIGENRKKGSLYRFFHKIQKTLPFHFLLGEGGLIYIISAYQKSCSIIHQEGVTLLYSSFGPYADHFIAYLLKRRFPKIRWIADFRDLQVEPLYKNVFFERMQYWMEDKILKKADLIATISDGLASHLGRYGRPILTVPRGVQLRPAEEHFTKFTICYTGSLYRNFRDADCFFRELSKLIHHGKLNRDEVQFIYVGRDGEQFSQWIGKYGLEKIYRNMGQQSRSVTMNIQNRSHLQLLLTSSTPEWGGIFTGKLFEYLESGNPIIVIIKGTRDEEFEGLMNETGAGGIFYDPSAEPEALSGFLEKHYNYWKLTNGVLSNLNREILNGSFSWNFQVERMLKSIHLSEEAI